MPQTVIGGGIISIWRNFAAGMARPGQMPLPDITRRSLAGMNCVGKATRNL